jgi:SAM-dependent methyltransferase
MCQKKGFRNVKLARAEKTGLKNGSFEIITMLDILEHTNDQKALQEASRILKEDGLVIATVPALKFLWSGWDKTLGHQRRYTKSSLTSVFRAHNFKILFMSYMYSFLLIPLILIRSIKEIFPRRQYGSDFNINNPLLNLIGLWLARIERQLLLRGLVPFGTSLAVVAKKR